MTALQIAVGLEKFGINSTEALSTASSILVIIQKFKNKTGLVNEGKLVEEMAQRISAAYRNTESTG